MTCSACEAHRGREYENDRDHLLSELAACRNEIKRLRLEVEAAYERGYRQAVAEAWYP